MNDHHSSVASAGTSLPPIHSYNNSMQHPQHSNRASNSPTQNTHNSGRQQTPTSSRPSSQPRSPSLGSSNIAATQAASGPISAAPGGGTPVQPRNTKARACTNCKTKKIACRPGATSGACAKCQRDGKRCIVEEPMPRPVRGKGTSKARVAEMEKKLDGLVALLTGAQSVSAGSSSGGVGPNAAHPSGPTMSDQEQAAIGLANLAPSLTRHYASPGNNSNSSHGDHPMPDISTPMSRVSIDQNNNNTGDNISGKDRHEMMCDNWNYIPPKVQTPNKPPLEDAIGRNLVNFEEAEHFFRIFSEMVTHFPFYIIPPGTTVESLRREKPVLLMAMLTTATSSNKRVQLALERDFRKVFSERVIGMGEKSLELLQAGLIYISWFQCHFSPKTQIFMQMMHLFISLVTDLGYDRKPEKERMFSSGPGGGGGGNVDAASPRYSDSGAGSPGKGQSDEEKELRSKEIRRAFLGTWWITNAISIDFRKRIPMHYTSYMRRCEQSFIDNPEYESDKHMVLLLKMQKLQEDVCETFRYNETDIASKMDLLRIQMSLKGFEAQLKELEREVDCLDPKHPSYQAVRPTLYVMGMYVHEIGLHMTPPPPGTTPFAPSISLEYTAERINILSDCLMYSKKYLDFVTRPNSARQLKGLTSPHWMRISYALIMLSKLALGGTEPVDICHLKEKTVIRSSTREYTLNPHPSISGLQDVPRKPRITRERTPSPDSRSNSVSFIPAQTSGYDGWDTSVVRSAVKMEVYLDRLMDICKILHSPMQPIREEDKARYKANGVEEVCPPDLYDFGGWMFGTMKEWFLAMVRREEEIEDAVKDAVSGTPGSAITGGAATPSGGSSVFSGSGSSRTRSTSVSVITPTGSFGELGPVMHSGVQPAASLKKRWDIEQSLNNGLSNGGSNASNPLAGSGVAGTFGVMNQGMVNVNPSTMMEDTQPTGAPMALPPTMGFDFMDTISDDFWGTVWSSYPQMSSFGGGGW